jgi:hypothetical protein
MQNCQAPPRAQTGSGRQNVDLLRALQEPKAGLLKPFRNHRWRQYLSLFQQLESRCSRENMHPPGLFLAVKL